MSVVERLNALHPDLIAVTGDLMDVDVEHLRPHIAPLRDMRARHGIFGVTNNHEYYSGATPRVAKFERLGMRVLINEHEVIEHDGATLIAAGARTSTRAASIRLRRATRSGPWQGRRPAWCQPSSLRTSPAAEQAGFDLQLSGHTHGDQFWQWSLFVPLQQLFTAGLHRLGWHG